MAPGACSQGQAAMMNRILYWDEAQHIIDREVLSVGSIWGVQVSP